MNSDVIFEDVQLVRLGVQGDREAFGRLVARYQSPVCALAYSACGSLNQAVTVQLGGKWLRKKIEPTAWLRLSQLNFCPPNEQKL
jgi:hypothetical protein